MQADVERFLAQILTDAALHERFLADPLGVASAAGLSPEAAQSVAAIPTDDLRIAARSYDYKRRSMRRRGGRIRGLLDRLRLWRRRAGVIGLHARVLRRCRNVLVDFRSTHIAAWRARPCLRSDIKDRVAGLGRKQSNGSR